MFIDDLQQTHNAEMHKTMARLYEEAEKKLGITRLSEIAAAVGETPQVLKNWEQRGVSMRGAIKIERKTGISAQLLLTGRSDGEPEEVQAEPSLVMSAGAQEIAALYDLIPVADRVARARAYNAATAAILDVLQGFPASAASAPGHKKQSA